MASSNLQTQCPHCKTRFKVTQQQLDVAKGRVRCGSCMQIFSASEQRQGASESDTRPSAETQIDIDDDNLVFADNPEEDAAHGPYISAEAAFDDSELDDGFRTIDRNASDVDAGSSVDADRGTDESWARAMLDEAGRHRGPRPHTAATPTEAEAIGNVPADGSGDTHIELQGLTTSRENMPPAFNRRSGDGDTTRSPQPPYSTLRQAAVPEERNHSGKIRLLAWSLIILAVLGVVISQLAWVQFDRFSKIPQLRPFYEQACELVGCELPPLIDMSAIDSRKLVVRTNPANRNELVVDAVIINRAAFAQPFPAIVLTFADLNGQVVTKRVFSPADYLADGGAQLREMSPEAPIRIAIAIKDPGQSAVSYNIDFRSESE